MVKQKPEEKARQQIDEQLKSAGWTIQDYIDITIKDTVIFAGYDEQAKKKARTIVDSFKKLIEENKYEITALQIIYSKPYSKRHLIYEEIREVADAIRKPPYQLTPEILW